MDVPIAAWQISLFILFCMAFPLPSLCHIHSHENPGFKYSREANKDFIKEDVLRQSSNDNFFSKSERSLWLISIGSTVLISAVPFALLFTIKLDNSETMRPRLKVLLAFASGGLLGDAFLHLIPHSLIPHHNESHGQKHSHHEGGHFHMHSDNHDRSMVVGMWVLAGIIAFLSVDKLVRHLKRKYEIPGHNHKVATLRKQNLKKEMPQLEKNRGKSDAKVRNKWVGGSTIVETSGYLNLAADFTHNFTDGLAIGASYLAGNSIGFVTTITVLLHEVPHEIGDFAILIRSGCSRRQAILLQLITALGAITGNILALIGIGSSFESAHWILPFTAGGFIYIATVSVIPELLEESTQLKQSIKEIVGLLTGVALMILIAYLE